MADTAEVTSTSAKELLAVGRRNLAVKDYNAAVETLGRACEALAKEHGDAADECAEAYLWYGKALLGLSREESGVLGDAVPNADDDEEQEENSEDNAEGETKKSGDAEAKENGEKAEVEKSKEEPTKDEEPGSSKPSEDKEDANDSNDEGDEFKTNEGDDVDNLQLAWEMLELSRGALVRRVQSGGGGGGSARALLADAHLALGEVALESETYDKAVLDMQNCLDLQKELYRSDDRRIAETHYQIGLANSLASNFEDAVTHFKNAANILETRIKNLESPTAATEDATVRKYAHADPQYSIESEIKELKGLLPEIEEKIQDMMDYKAETMRRLRETLCPSNGAGSSQNGGTSSQNGGISSQNGAGPSTSSSAAKPVASDISHLIRRKRKASDGEESAAKKSNT